MLIIKLINNFTPYDSVQLIYGFPGCLEPIKAYWVITVESNCHLVSRADDGTRLVGPTIFLSYRSEGDKNIVISTGGMVLHVETLEGEHDLLIWGDLYVPSLTSDNVR